MTFPEFMWNFDVVCMSILVLGVPLGFIAGEIIDYINDMEDRQ